MKRFQKVLLAAACALVLAAPACATPKGSQRAARQVECTDTPPVGSHIGRQKCYDRGTIDERRADDQRRMEKIQFDTNRPRFDSKPLVVSPSAGGIHAYGTSWSNARR